MDVSQCLCKSIESDTILKYFWHIVWTSTSFYFAYPDNKSAPRKNCSSSSVIFKLRFFCDAYKLVSVSTLLSNSFGQNNSIKSKEVSQDLASFEAGCSSQLVFISNSGGDFLHLLLSVNALTDFSLVECVFLVLAYFDNNPGT